MVVPGWLPILLAELLPNFLPERLPRILSELLSVMCPKHSDASNRHPEEGVEDGSILEREDGKVGGEKIRVVVAC